MGSADRKPSLEAPSLGFRRRKKESPSAAEEPAAPAPVVSDEDVPVEAASLQVTVAETATVVEESTADETFPAVEEPTVAEAPAVARAAPTVVAPSREAPPVVQAPVAQAPVGPVRAEEPAPRRRPLGPIDGHVAAAVAGVVVAVFLVAATLGGLQACQSIRGTTSCGGGPGFFLLLLIVVVAVVVGAVVLRAAQVPSAGSISFLAVALVSVVSVLFLLDVLDQRSGAIAVGLVTVASYLLAHWVTVRYLDAVE